MDKNLMIAKYRWEFLRRNTEYKNDWIKYFKQPNIDLVENLLKKYGAGSFPQSRDFNKKWENINRISGTIWSKEWEREENWPELKEVIMDRMWQWARNKPYSSFSFLLRPSSSELDENIVSIDAELKSDEYCFRNEKGEAVPLTKEDIPEELDIKIHNFKKYLTSDTRTMNELREAIQSEIYNQLKMWEYVSKNFGLSESKAERFRFSEYDTYLKVWDLVEEKGRKWTEIAKKIYFKDADSDSSHVKVQQHHKQASELIEKARYFFQE